MWGTMKWHLRKHVKPKTKELIQGIKQFWALVTPQMCTRYIRHIDKVVLVVILLEEEQLQGTKNSLFESVVLSTKHI